MAKKVKPKKKQRKASKKGKAKLPALSKQDLKALKRQKQKVRKEFLGTFIPSVLIGIVLAIPLAIAIDPKIGVMMIGAIPIARLSFKYPRQAIWAFLIYTPLSGTVTYALGGSAVLQLAKDGFYLPGLYGIYQACRRKRQPLIIEKSLTVPLYILIACTLITLFTINLPQQFDPPFPEDKSPFLLGILGIKVFLGYIPLVFVAYYLVKGKKELLTITRLHTGLAILCCALGFIQYLMLLTGRCEGTDHLTGADLFKATIDARCFVGGSLVWSPSQGMVRLPGTFVAPWQWAWFLIANAFLTFATAFNDPSPLWRLIGLTGMAGVFINAVISGQRIALALVPVVTVLLMILTGQVTNLKRFIPILLGLVTIISLGFILFPEVVQERIDSFVGRWNASPADDFIGHQFDFVSKELKGSLFGLGVGRATNSARLFGRTALVETWFPKVAWEVGPLGLLAFLGFVTAITIATFKAYRSVKDKNLRGMAASYWVFILFISYQTYYYPLDVDPVAVYYWVWVGVTLKLPHIDREEARKKREQEEAEAAELAARRAARQAKMASAGSS
jgi:hypothetical protein